MINSDDIQYSSLDADETLLQLPLLQWTVSSLRVYTTSLTSDILLPLHFAQVLRRDNWTNWGVRPSFIWQSLFHSIKKIYVIIVRNAV